MRLKLQWSRPVVLRYGGATLISAVAGLSSDIFFRVTGVGRLSSIFLGGVLLAAFLFGSGPGYLASGLCFVLYLWLVDPRYKFEFGSTEDFDTLMVFLAVSALIGLLIGRMRDEAAAARRRTEATENLLQATQDFANATDEEQIRDELAERLAAAARGRGFVRHGLALRIWPEQVLDQELAMESLAIQRAVREAPLATRQLAGWTYRPLRAGDAALGVAAWRGASDAEVAADEAASIDILVDAAAAAIARSRLAAAKAEAEGRARTEDLRNALLSSISHDVRTPLAAIVASASSLQQFGAEFDEATRRDLAATIEEEAVRLDGFVANLLNMSRLEAGALKIEASAFSVVEVVSRIVERRRGLWTAPVNVLPAPRLPEALGDAILFEQALGNVLENALRYGDDAPIDISAARCGQSVCVRVRDHGPGVGAEDVQRIFQKFYRAPTRTKTSGTGLGLSIAKGLVQAMGGEIVAENRQDPRGLQVTISLPVAA